MGPALLTAFNTKTIFFLLKRKKKRFANPTFQAYALITLWLYIIYLMLSTVGTQLCLPAA